MATAIQRRRGTATQHSSFTGLAGEITIDTTNNTVIVHDGSTQGGHRLATFAEVTSAATGDITAIVAGNGLSGGAASGSATLDLDLNELTAVAVDVANDSIALIDATDNGSKKESIADLVSGMAGTNLTASSGTLGIATSVIRGMFSAGGDLSYDSGTGVISFTNDAGDIESVTAGNGLSGGGTSGAVSLALDLNELSAAAVDVAADSIAIIDAGDNSSKKETIADLVAAMAGTNLSASNGVLSTVADITGVTAGNGLSGGGTSGALTLALDTSSGTFTTGVQSFLGGGTLAGHIIPSADNTYDLGSTSKTWRDVYVGPGSLYVNGQQVVSDSSGTIQISANANQNVGVITSGSGDIELNASGTGVINLQSAITIDSGQVLTGTGGLTMGSNINVNSNYLNNVGTPVQNADAATKLYVDQQVAAKDALSELSGDSDDITEGSTNLFHSTERVQDVAGAQLATNGSHTGIAFTYDDAGDGAIDAVVSSSFVRGLVSVTDAGGDGSLAYNSGTGVITYTGPSASEVRAHLSAGTGINYSGGAFSTDDSEIVHDSLSGFVSNEHIDHSGVTLTAGDGLSGGGTIAASRSFAVDSTVVRTSGTQTVGGAKTFSADAVFQGNVTISGTQTVVNTQTLTVADNIVVLNSGTSGAPSENAGLQVDRGSSADIFLRWNESTDIWEFTNNGSTYYPLATDTDDLTEGSSNLYYQDARADARIAANLIDEDSFATNSSTRAPSQQSVKAYVAAQIATKDALSELSGDSDDVSEGSTNLYFTNGRVDTRIAALDSDSLSEGSTNLYFTNGRADTRADARIAANLLDEDNFASDSATNTASQQSIKAYVASQLATKDALSELSGDSDDISEGSTNLFFSNERVDDRVGALIQGGTNITVTYNDGAGTLTIDNDNTADITGVTAGDGLTGGGSSGSVTLNVGAGNLIDVGANSIDVDLSELTDMTGAVDSSADEIVLLDNGAQRRKLFSEIGLSVFSNDSGFTTNVGDITAVVAGNGLTGGATSGSATLNIGAGTGISVAANDVSVSGLTVSEFAGGSIQTGSESFSDSDSVLMTAAAVNDRILAFGYTTNTGDITGVTAGTGLSGGGASGSVTLNVSGLTVSELAGGSLQTSGESFSDSNSVLMTAAAINDRIQAFGYTTNVGDITGVSVAGTGLSGGGSSGAVTITSNATSANTGGAIVARDGSGNFSAGTITATATQARYADLAEVYEADAEYEPGTVVVFGGDAEVKECSETGDHRVAGVVSTDPAYLMNAEAKGVAVALCGRVPVKVHGPVAKGDLLVTSAQKGHAKADNKAQQGRIIGKAISAHEGGADDVAVIEVLVNLM